MYNIGICIILLCIIIYLLCKNSIDNMINKKRVCNQLDGRCYQIVNEFDKDTHEKASKTLAEVNLFSIQFIKFMKVKYLWNQGPLRWETLPLKHYQDMTKRLMENYNPSSLTENAPPTASNTSYVEDKGKVFAVCIREKETGKNHIFNEGEQKNTLDFVVLHELAHIASPSYGHGDEYWQNYGILLKNAEEAGLYVPQDYRKKPVDYCQLKIDNNPYFHGLPI